MGRLAVFLPDDFADWEAAFLLAAGRHFFGLATRTFSLDGHPVRSVGGLVVSVVDAARAIAPEDFDLLALIGSDVWAARETPDLGVLPEKFLDKGRCVAAICGATLALARAGILDGRRHTSNSLGFLKENAPGYRGDPLYQEPPLAVCDGGVVTASGSAPVSFAAEVFRLLGQDERGIATFETLCAREHLFRAQRTGRNGHDTH